MQKYNEKQGLLKYLNDLNQSIDKVKCKLCGNILNEDELKHLEKEKELTKLKIEELTEIPEPNLEYEGYRNILNDLEIDKINRKEFVTIESQLNKIVHEIASLTSKHNNIKEKLISVDEEEPLPGHAVSQVAKIWYEMSLKAKIGDAGTHKTGSQVVKDMIDLATSQKEEEDGR